MEVNATMALPCVKISFLLEILFIYYTVLCSFVYGFQQGAAAIHNISGGSSGEDVLIGRDIPVSQRAEYSTIPVERSNVYSGKSTVDVNNGKSKGGAPPQRLLSDNTAGPSYLLQITALNKLNHSTIDGNQNQTYSVTSPFGVDGQPLLSGNTKTLQGYKTYPRSNTIVPNRPFDSPLRHDSFWDQFNSKPGSQYGTHSTSNSYLWDFRRLNSANSNINPNHAGGTSINVLRTPSRTEQNQELVRSILTEALDILTLRPSEKENNYKDISCWDTKGYKTPCGSSSFKKSKNEIDTTNNICANGSSDRSCKTVLTYYDVFSSLLQKVENAQHVSRPTNDNIGTGGLVGDGAGFGGRIEHGAGFDGRIENGAGLDRTSHDLPQPQTRTVFRSVETSPTSSLARLFNSDGNTIGNGGNSQGSSSSSNTGKANSGSGSGSGSTSSNQNGGSSGSYGGAGRGGSGSGSGMDSPTLPVGVSLEVFNKFTKDVVSFEQQSATEIKRIDNLLRQLAMAAQTDFTSVSNSVNVLQQELIQTQQQLVQAWSILNATHVRDNLQTAGDLRDVKTDVYRLHALLTGATPLGQGTAHGRAAEVKEVAAIGPGVDCAALYKSGVNTSGVYDLQPQPTDNGTRMTAFCDMETDGGGWTVFQRRRDGSDDFFRGWNSYKHGFGSYRHDHWLGLENIHLLTKYGDNVMRIELTDWDNKTRWAEFSYTRIMDESDGYRILVGGYRGTAGDPFHSLSYSMRMQSMRFSTFDSDNDLDSGGNCALTFTSGWWFNKCFQVNLNGVWYGNSRYAGPSMNGIVWDLWPEHFNGYSLKYTEMKLRPAGFLNKK